MHAALTAAGASGCQSARMCTTDLPEPAWAAGFCGEQDAGHGESFMA